MPDGGIATLNQRGPLAKLVIESPGSPWFLSMTDMSRDKSMMSLVLVVSRQSVTEGCERGGSGQGLGVLPGGWLLGSHLTPVSVAGKRREGCTSSPP